MVHGWPSPQPRSASADRLRPTPQAGEVANVTVARVRARGMTVAGPLVTLLVCGFALWRGGRPERVAAGLVLVALAGTILAQAVLGRATVWPVIGADLLVSAGLLVLAFAFGRRWTLVAIGLAAGLLLVHSLLLEDGATITPLYRRLVAGFNLAFLATLAVGSALAGPRARRPG